VVGLGVREDWRVMGIGGGDGEMVEDGGDMVLCGVVVG
jgi:hypothetical protein